MYLKLWCIYTHLNPVSSARTLQHPALLQCLAQCSEVTPYLLVMEFCPLVGHTCLFSLFQIPHCSLSLHFVAWIILKQSEQPFPSPLRVTWRATCTVVEWLTPRLRTLCSSSEWRVTLPPGFCTSTNTTLYTGTACQSAQLFFTFININAQERKNPPVCFVLPLLVSPCNNILVLPE